MAENLSHLGQLRAGVEQPLGGGMAQHMRTQRVQRLNDISIFGLACLHPAILNLARLLTMDSNQECDLPPAVGPDGKQSWDQAVVGAFATECERREERLRRTVGEGDVTGRSAQESKRGSGTP